MSAALLIAAAQGPVSTMTGMPYDEQIQPLLESLLTRTALPARAVQELHWFSASEEYWFTALAQRVNLAPDLPHFHWPAVPLLSHAILQSISRAIEVGERDLVLLGQQSGELALVLLLASQSAMDQHHLVGRATIDGRADLNRRPDGFVKAAARRLSAAGRSPADIRMIASPVPLTAAEVKAALPSAKGLLSGSGPQTGDLFLFDRLVSALEDSHQSHGLLISTGPHGSGLATWVERISVDE